MFQLTSTSVQTHPTLPQLHGHAIGVMVTSEVLGTGFQGVQSGCKAFFHILAEC